VTVTMRVRGDAPLRIRLADPEVGLEEVEAMAEVLASGTLTNGPRTAAFEERFAERHQVEHAVAVANGTVALTGMYLAAGIGPGDQPVFAELGAPAELPVTDELSSRLLSVPFHSRLSRDELTEIADSLSRAVAAR
jgi:dTDP-4-amino-4,6-dideoxygalactose transaminase